jgi:DNA polymerase-3 subunit epsilon
VTGRQLILVDVETSGLDRARDVAVEIAWWNATTGEHDVFVPAHDVAWVLEHGDPEALRLNRYHDRLSMAVQDADQSRLAVLGRQLAGNTMGGSNPGFDDDFVARLWLTNRHHRLFDIANYTAGFLGVDPTDLPGLERVCELLGVRNHAPHTAMGDVDAVRRCLIALKEWEA